LSIDLNTTAVFTVTDNQAETVNLALVDTAGDDDHVLTLSSTTATSVNVTGTGTAEDLALTAAGALLTTVNASALVGNFTYDIANRAAQAMTITTGTGNDTVGMTFAADVIDGGTKTSDNDTLNISFSGTGGALIVDLSSATDQVQMFNGLSNAAAQKNFESVNASAYTQSNSVGADITGSTGANTITGTGYADTIRTGLGADAVTGGAGADAIILTESTDSQDTVIFSTVATNGNDTITGFTVGSGKDILKVTGLATLTDTAGDTVQIASTATSTTAVGTAKAFIITDQVAADWSTLLATIGAAFDESGAGAAKSVIVVSNSTDTRVYLFQGDGVDNTVQAGELTLVATVVGVVTGNFAVSNVVVV
jgi:hypothetical protein